MKDLSPRLHRWEQEHRAVGRLCTASCGNAGGPHSAVRSPQAVTPYHYIVQEHRASSFAHVVAEGCGCRKVPYCARQGSTCRPGGILSDPSGGLSSEGFCAKRIRFRDSLCVKEYVQNRSTPHALPACGNQSDFEPGQNSLLHGH